MTKPNIIYILADDLGYGDVSYLNEQAAFKTPHLDSIAANGIAFTDAHSTSAVCTPSRYSILTGRYNWRSRLKYMVLNGYSEPLIEPGRRTVADMLSEQGYRTAAIGKWHLGMSFPSLPSDPESVDYSARIKNGPTANGFDTYFGISASLDMPPYVYIEDDRFTGPPTRTTEGTGKGFFRKGPTAEDFDHSEVMEVLTGKVLERIEAWQDDPFFIYYPLTAPHTPILPPKEYLGRSGTNEYGDFVLYCDDLIGSILDKLKELDLFDNTLVIFTSDNGCSPEADFPELLEHGHNPNYIFRGHKADIYEGGHRIPLLMQWPDAIAAGRRCDSTVSLVDLMATLAEHLDYELPDTMGEDSVSILPLLLDKDGYGDSRTIVQQSGLGYLALREGPWKLAMCPGSGGWSWPVPGDEEPGMPEFQLFNLNQDIGEQTNLIYDEPERAERMTRELMTIIRSGRSTPGDPQENNGAEIWEAVEWLRDR